MYIHKRLIPLFILVLLFPLPAMAADEIEGKIGDGRTGLNLAAVGEVIDYNLANNSRDGFSAHKMNYILPLTVSNYHRDRQDIEIKFQISVKQRLLAFYGWAFFFAYTQTSFWQAYDVEGSSPFRENVFNPEIFLRTKMWDGMRFDSGIEHNSNGRAGVESRTWNRVYITPYYENERFILSLKGWCRVKTGREQRINENPGITRYYGYAELGAALKFPSLRDTRISGIFRYNPVWNRGAAEVNLTIPMLLNSMKWMFHYYEGYGESLIDYNIYQRKGGLGFCFTI
jgi:phospholipase A1